MEKKEWVFKICLLLVLVWIALEIRGIHIPRSFDVDAEVSNAYGSFSVDLNR